MDEESEIQVELEKLRAQLVQRLGGCLAGFGVERIVQHDDAARDTVVLVVRTQGMLRVARHNLMEDILDQLADSRSKVVRERITLTLR